MYKIGRDMTLTCVNCGLPIRPDRWSPTGWTHGRWRRAPDWQGKRCPGAITGATPAPQPKDEREHAGVEDET